MLSCYSKHNMFCVCINSLYSFNHPLYILIVTVVFSCPLCTIPRVGQWFMNQVSLSFIQYIIVGTFNDNCFRGIQVNKVLSSQIFATNLLWIKHNNFAYREITFCIAKTLSTVDLFRDAVVTFWPYS